MSRKSLIGLAVAVAGLLVALAWIRFVSDIDNASTDHNNNRATTEKIDVSMPPTGELETSSNSGLELEKNQYPPVKFLTNSVYPESPYDVFVANYEKALNGDVDSQFLIYKVISECSAVPRDPSVAAKVVEIMDDPNVAADFKFRLERCKLIQGTDEELKSEKRHWYTKAYENGHPTIVAWQEVMYNNDRSVAREALLTALQTDTYEAYEYAALYLGMKGTNQTTDENAVSYSDPWLYSACQSDPGCDLSTYEMQIRLAAEPWTYLSCSKNPGCNVDQYEDEVLASMYHESTLREIKDRAIQIQSLLAAGRLDELGL